MQGSQQLLEIVSKGRKKPFLFSPQFYVLKDLVSFFTSIMVSANKVALHASTHKRAAGACLHPQTPAGQLSC